MHEDDPIDAALTALAEADRAAVPSAQVTRAVMAAFDERLGAPGATTTGGRWRWAAAAAMVGALMGGIDTALRDRGATRAARAAVAEYASADAQPPLAAASEGSSFGRGVAAVVPPAPVPGAAADAAAGRAGGSQVPKNTVARGGRRRAPTAIQPERLRAVDGADAVDAEDVAGGARAGTNDRAAGGAAETFAAEVAADDAFVELVPTTLQDFSTVRLVRVRLPESALRQLSISPPGPPREGFVQADVLLGDDGFARAIRVVR